MDPLSISASVAGLVTLADLVFRAATNYVKTVRGSYKEVHELSREVRNLSVVLHDLSLVAFELEAESAAEDDNYHNTSALKPYHLHECRQLLRRLEEKLCGEKSYIESTSSIQRLRGRLKWPFTSAETKAILQDVLRHKQTIDTALAADSVSKLRLCLSRQEETNARIERLQITANGILDMEIQASLDKKKKEVLDFFSKHNYHTEFETNKRLRHMLTGLWLTEGPEFTEWHDFPGSRIWFSGIPGAGKSVIAALIIEECLQRAQMNLGTAVAYYFCLYRDERTHSPSSILSSLCIQLALQDENALSVLSEYYDELKSKKYFSVEPSADRLVAVLRLMCASFNRVYIVIDGLDECGDQVEDAAKSLSDLATSLTDDIINMAILSRNEIAIRHILDSRFHNVEIAAHTEDIQEYVASEINQRINTKKLRLRDLRLKDQIMAKLVEGAQGMFRWVACQLDHICDLPTDRARREALLKLPPTLPATYERILMKIETYSEEVKRLVQRTLVLINSRLEHYGRPTFQEICEAVSLGDDSDTLFEDEVVEEEEILRWCGSLIRTSNDGRHIEFAHFTVQEYLHNDCAKHDTLSFYSLSDEAVCNTLGPICLRYLILEDHEWPLEVTADGVDAVLRRTEQYPFYEHAATSWPLYTNLNPATQQFSSGLIHDLFRLPKTPSFCSWAIELMRHCLSKEGEVCFTKRRDFGEDIDTALHVIDAVMRPDFTPLHMAAALGMPELCRHLVKQGANVTLRSKFGTALHCALGSLTTFADGHILYPPRSWFGFSPVTARRETVQFLLEAGSEPDLLLVTPFKTITVLSLAASSSWGAVSFDIVADLIKTGIAVEDEDLCHFEEYYEQVKSVKPDVFKRAFYDGKPVIRLLETLRNHGALSPSKSRFYTTTLNFAKHMKLEITPHSSYFQPSEESSDQEAHEFVFSAIKNNDVSALNQFLQSSRADLVRSMGIDAECKTSTLHIAVGLESLNILNSLLDFGVDLELVDEWGRTPVQLCSSDDDEDALRVLLKHGASTINCDEHGRSVWHLSAEKGSERILKVLLELDEMERALEMESRINETPLGAALRFGHASYVQLLLPYCSSKRAWKSCKSMYRSAAELGSARIIQALIGAGVEKDGMDDKEGNPLHFLSIEAPVECIRLLKEIFPLEQRRQLDFKTPLESMLQRAVNVLGHQALTSDVVEELLPNTAISDPREASALWMSACTKTVWIAVNTRTHSRLWFENVFYKLIELGIVELYETYNGESALIAFVYGVATDIQHEYEGLLQRSETAESWPHNQWEPFSATAQIIAKRTRFWPTAAKTSTLVRLLSQAMLHDDLTMMALLLGKGVDVHTRTDKISPFDFACFPDVSVTKEGLDLLLASATPSGMIEGIESLGGCGPLHFVAGFQSKRGGPRALMTLQRLLQAGADCDQPVSSEYGSPLTHHIQENAISTAELLLECGADPWGIGSYHLDAALMAARMGHSSFLEKIATAADRTTKTWVPRWDRTWVKKKPNEDPTGGNALHLAAIIGEVECLSFYLDRGLLIDLEHGENGLGTPLHYAAANGHSSIIEFLHNRGANINARDNHGVTPLHEAVSNGNLEAVKVLLRLGATHQVCDAGCTPITYAFAEGDQDIIETLQTSSQQPRMSNALVTSPWVLQSLETALLRAIRRDDVAECSKIHAAGCPVDIELNHHRHLTPLMLAICERRSPAVVRWLLDAGASVAAKLTLPYRGKCLDALQAAAGTIAFNPLLPELVTKYLQEGGDILSNSTTPLHIAVEEGNSEGVGLLLSTVRKLNESQNIQRKTNFTSMMPSLTAFIHHQTLKTPKDTALHLAADLDNLDIAIKLVENGADIDRSNEHSETALHCAVYAESLDVVRYLLSRGANINASDCRGRTPLTIACKASRLNWKLISYILDSGKSTITTEFWRTSVLHRMLDDDRELAARNAPHITMFQRFLDEGVDLHQKDGNGVSPVHLILVSHHTVYLRWLLNRDIAVLRIQDLGSWPPGLFVPSPVVVVVDRLVFLAKSLRLLRPFINKDGMKQLLGCKDTGSHSLLCWAACCGVIEALQQLLALSPESLGHHCREHGTALEAALSLGRDEVVKCLVRLGAQLPDDLLQKSANNRSTATPLSQRAILKWLFVDRHTERARIGYDKTDDAKIVGHWVGPAVMKVSLRWEWRKSRHESIWEYACRRSRILMTLRGTVVEPLRSIEDTGNN